MNIRKNRIIRAFSVSIGPLIISIGQFFQLHEMIYYPILSLLVAIILFIVFFLKTPKYYIKEKEDGFIISGSKKGLYDPDYVEFSKITNIERKGSTIELKNNNAIIELYLPSKYRDSFIDYVKVNIIE